jgi:predicted nucleic acid-binding protein
VIAPDSSVVIAALGQWHPAHEASRAAIVKDSRKLIAHVAVETVSALSRMPEPYRVVPEVVVDALDRIYSKPWLALDAVRQRSYLLRAIHAGLRGGALYDALIAATAIEHGATLLSADRRASVTYKSMGLTVSFIEP